MRGSVKSSEIKRWVLLNPGPVNVTPRVRRALLKPDLCHREKEFADLLRKTRWKILKIFGISKTHTAAIFSGSGTAALESMLSSFAEPNKKVLVLSNGVYGERIKTILEIHGCPTHVLSSQPGEFPNLSKIESVLKKDRSIKAVAMVHHETSTGTLNPIAAIGRLAKKYKKTFLLDAISSLGAERIDFKKFSVDYCVGTSGKCLHGFPGVSFVIVSKKEVLKLKDQKPRTLYLDLLNTLAYEEKNETPFTPSVQVFYAFNEALDELLKQGLEKRVKNYQKKSHLLEKGFIKLGLSFLVEKKHRSHVLTALWTPKKITYEKLHDHLKKKGFIIYAGQSKLKGKIFRISNLGDVSFGDLKKFLSILEHLLATLQ